MQALRGLSGLSGLLGISDDSEPAGLVALEAPIDTSNAAKHQLTFGYERGVDDYVGSVAQFQLASGGATQDFGCTATGRFNRAAMDAWRGGADVNTVKFYDQGGSGKEMLAKSGGVASTLPFIVGNVYVCLGTEMDPDTAILTRSATDGAVTCNITGGKYLELTSSGLSADSGMEVHLLGSSNLRKIANNDSSDPLSGDDAGEVYASYGVATNNNFYLGSGAAGGTGNFTYRLNRISGSSQDVQGAGDIKANALMLISARVDNDELSIYGRGTQIQTASTNATNDTANAALDNGTLRVGRMYPGLGDEATMPGSFRFSAIVITQTLTAAERGLLRDKLHQVGMQHRAAELSTLISSASEVLFWNHANLTTGKLYGLKANLSLTINIATTIGGTNPAWTASAADPYFGYTGLRSTGVSVWANGFVADTNYFMDQTTGAMLNLDFRTAGTGAKLGQIMASGSNTTIAGLKSSAGTNTDWHIAQGYHHSQPCFYGRIYGTLDTTGKTNQGVGGGWGDQSLSQATWKYMFVAAHGDLDTREDLAVTLSSPVTGETRTWNIGEDVTWANALTDLNIYPATPESRTYHNWTQKFSADDDQLLLQIANFDDGSTYNPSSPVVANMRTGSVWSYAMPAGTGGIGGQDHGYASKEGWAAIVQGNTTGRLQSMPYNEEQYDGIRMLTAFKAGGNWTDAEIEQWNVNKYKFWEALTVATPVNLTLPILSGTAADGQTMTGTDATFNCGLLTPWMTYQWQYDDGGWTNIGGATSQSYAIESAVVDYALRRADTATVYDGTTSYSATAYSAPTAVVVAGAPVFSVNPVISGTSREGEQLSCTTGTVIGTPPFTYAYQWYVDTTPVGIDSANYTLQTGQAGMVPTCEVTATNSVGSTPATSNALAAIAPGLSIPTPTWTYKFDSLTGLVVSDEKGGPDLTYAGAPTTGTGYISQTGGANTGWSVAADADMYTNQKWSIARWFKLNSSPAVQLDILALGTNASTLAANRAFFVQLNIGATSLIFTVTNPTTGDTNNALTVSGLALDTTNKALVILTYDPTGGDNATILTADIYEEGTGLVASGSLTTADQMRQNAAFKLCDRRSAAGSGSNLKEYRIDGWANRLLLSQEKADIFTAGSEGSY